MMAVSDLLPILLSKTQEKKLVWHYEREDSVWVKLGSGIVEITTDLNFDGNLDKVLRIRNSDGSIIDETSFSVTEFGYDDLTEIVRSARRVALKVDETLNSIFNQLERL